MKNVLFLLLIGSMIASVSGCKKTNDIVSPGNGNSDTTGGKIIATGTIGIQGGTLSTSEVAIAIPQGSISTSATITIVEATQNYGGTTQFSKAYTIEGLPQGFQGKLGVKIKYTKPLQNSSYVSSYFTTTPKSVGHSITSFNYFEAKDSSGFLISSIDFGSGAFGLKKSVATDDTKVTVTAASGIDTSSFAITPDPHMAFVVYREANAIPLNWVIKLGEALAASSALYSTMGFSYSARSSTRPFPIYIINDPTSDDFGYYSRGFPWTINGSYITVNYAKVQIDDDIRSIAAHEYFHFIHSCYGLSDDATLWYQEALTTYAEELIQPDPASFYSAQFLLYYNRPFFGIEAGKLFIDNDVTVPKPARHGYGMGVFIKELFHNSNYKDPTALLKLVTNVSTNKSVPVDAIKSVFPDYVDVWKTYLDKFFTGRVSFIRPSTIRGEGELDPQRTRTWTVATAGDTLKTYNENMYDLSAKVYRIHLNKDFDDLQDLKIISTPLGDKSEIEVSVYKYKNANNTPAPEFVTKSVVGRDTTIVSDLKGIKSGYTSLIVLVTNRHAVNPYEGMRSLSLTFKIEKQEFLAQLRGANNFTFTAYGTSTNNYYISKPITLTVWNFGWTSPTAFSYAYTEPHGPGTYIELKTSLNGQLSLDGKTLNSVAATYVVSTYNSASQIIEVETTELSAANLPLSPTGYLPGYIAVYSVNGAAASSNVTKYHYRHVRISYSSGSAVQTVIKDVTSTTWTIDSMLYFRFEK
ncbi:MAG: hypothetical protein NTV54_15540 [Ignavibacteriales bacterium]|nr:hypothetical protein [Ignavibacteriales bacterium]